MDTTKYAYTEYPYGTIVWLVYFRGECEYCTPNHDDADGRANQLRNGFGDERVLVIKSVVA